MCELHVCLKQPALLITMLWTVSRFLEDTGVALSIGTVRLGYFAGGDGESKLLLDLNNAAGFVRDGRAIM